MYMFSFIHGSGAKIQDAKKKTSIVLCGGRLFKKIVVGKVGRNETILNFIIAPVNEELRVFQNKKVMKGQRHLAPWFQNCEENIHNAANCVVSGWS